MVKFMLVMCGIEDMLRILWQNFAMQYTFFNLTDNSFIRLSDIILVRLDHEKKLVTFSEIKKYTVKYFIT